MRVLVVVLAVLFVASCGTEPSSTPSSLGTNPASCETNPVCPPGTIEFKIEGNTVDYYNDTFDLPDGTNSVTVVYNGTSFSWTSTLGMDAVIAKGGPGGNVYTYDPESFGDPGPLQPPDWPVPGQVPGLSHITFCYDYELVVTKTADTSFDRAYTWDILKQGDQTSVTMLPSETLQVNYTATLTNTHVDSNWAVSGKITVLNPAPAPYNATVTGVTDTISGIGLVTVSCPKVTFPLILPAGDSFECDYTSALPDASARVNEATATTSGGAVGDGTGTADVVFGDPTNVTDECVDVTDDKYPGNVLGTYCEPVVIPYSMWIGPFECGLSQFVNTATFVTNDTGATDSSSWTVDIEVPCDVGCSLTQGYWKTHSDYGPAPYDDTWLAVGGPDAPFFSSGQSYYQVMWTPPQGNAYYNLAHQYIAAELNKAAGASFDDAQAAFDAATLLFQTYTPDEVAADKKLRKDFVPLTATLDDYNNGLIGPGHCTE
jgi:hypothetical protein